MQHFGKIPHWNCDQRLKQALKFWLP